MDAKANGKELSDAQVIRGAGMSEGAVATGEYYVECFDAEGRLKWADTVKNAVCTEGKNLALDKFLQGTTYTTVGPFIGLISINNYNVTGPVAANTAANITASGTASPTNNWNEVASSVVSARGTVSWSAASGGSKALSSGTSFSIGGAGDTIKGCFMITGTGAVSTVASTAGTLWSAGLFTGGDKVTASGDTVVVSYTTSL